MISTPIIHRLKPLALVAAFAAFAAPAMADPPQLQIDTPAHLGAPDGWAGQYTDGGPPAARLGALDGWAAQYADGRSGASAHPDNRPRFVQAEQANGGTSDTGSGFDWRASLLGVLAFGLALAAAATLILRLRTRLVRA